MKFYITYICIIISVTSHAQGIQFQQDITWGQLKEKARLENKYIFIDAFATWCIPCQAMAKEVFPKKVLGEFINKKFIAVKVQMDRTKNDNDFVKSWYTASEEIRKLGELSAYPSILYLSPEGEIIGKSVGYKDAVDLLSDATRAVSGKITVDSLRREYLNGNNDSTFIKKMAIKAEELGQIDVANTIAKEFIDSLSTEDLLKIENVQFAYRFTNSINDRYFPIFANQKDRLNAVLGKNNLCEIKVRGIITKEVITPLINNSIIPDWSSIEAKVKKYGQLGLESYYGERMIFNWPDKKDWVEYGKYYALYYKMAFARSKFNINNVTWFVFQHVNDRKVLEIAIKTMKYNNDNLEKNTPNSIDTYANLLYKAGYKAQAIAAQEKAVELSKNGKAFLETLNKMKAGKPTW